MDTNEHKIDAISDEDFASLQALSGTTHPVLLNSETATKDAIRHFADGIGDPNPLWRDESYARQTRYGGLIASPGFLNAIIPGQWSKKLPGAAHYVTGSEWEWFRTIFLNDTFTVTNTFEDVTIKRAGPVGQRLFLLSGRLRYNNQKDQTVGICRWSTMWAESGRSKPKSADERPVETERYVYSKQELQAIEKAYSEEEIRGVEPCYWEDVAIGEQIKPVVKGPLAHADMLAFTVGIGFLGQAHGLSPRVKEHRGWRDPETGVLEAGESVHFLDKVARSHSGQPFAFNMGIQRFCWLGHLLSNWYGNDGFLKKLEGQIRRVSYLGDTTWCRGKITNKYIKDGEHLVECEVWCENQKHEINTTGRALIVLHSKGEVVRET